MTFTGTLIEELMATVERAEQRAQAAENFAAEPVFVQPVFVQPMVVEGWFASVQQNPEYDSKLLGVA